jgi:hypothetical protein
MLYVHIPYIIPLTTPTASLHFAPNIAPKVQHPRQCPSRTPSNRPRRSVLGGLPVPWRARSSGRPRKDWAVRNGCCRNLSGAKRREWMGMGVAGIIIDS